MTAGWRRMQTRLEETGRDAGIVFHFGDITRSPNTLDAHRVIRWAASADGRNVQNAVAKRLFQFYFEEGRDVGDRAVLIEAARECGMDAALVETLLAADADVAEVKAEIDTARRMGVTGVPCLPHRKPLRGHGRNRTLKRSPTPSARSRKQKARGELGHGCRMRPPTLPSMGRVRRAASSGVRRGGRIAKKLPAGRRLKPNPSAQNPRPCRAASRPAVWRRHRQDSRRG